MKKGKKKASVSMIPRLSLVAGVGFEPHDLRVMSPTSYRAALPRDILNSVGTTVVPETGLEPVRYSRSTGF